MVKDVLGNELCIGDYVVYHYNHVPTDLKPGVVYQVISYCGQSIEVMEIGVRINVFRKALPEYFVKLININNDKFTEINYQEIALAVTKLINSKPRSPLPSEIEECLRHQINNAKSGEAKTG